jgi:hypothetical protein
LGSRLNPIKKYDASPQDPRLKWYVAFQAWVVLTAGNAALVMRFYTASLISSVCGISDFAGRTIEAAALFVLTLAGLCTVSWLQETSSHHEVRKVLKTNLGFHGIVVLLVALFYQGEPAWPAALMAAYLFRHGICTWRLGTSPEAVREESLMPSEGEFEA